MNFEPGQSVTKLKEQFPNASITDVKAAWLKPNDSLKMLSGPGIAGVIYLKFSHNDAAFEEARADIIKKIEFNPTAEHKDDQSLLDIYSELLNAPLDTRLALQWVRFVPPVALPFSRLEARYGKPEKCDYKADTFEPYCEWTKRGVSVSLDDKKLLVLSVDYSFTADDWKRRWGIPAAKSNPSEQEKVSPTIRNKKTM